MVGFEKVLCYPVATVANVIEAGDQIRGRKCLAGFSVNVNLSVISVAMEI